MDVNEASRRIRRVLGRFKCSDDYDDLNAVKSAVLTLKEELRTAVEVNISECGITDNGIAMLLARAFDRCDPNIRRPLKVLSIRSNDFTDVGFRVFARAMKEAKLEALTTFDVSGNSLSKAGAQALVQALGFFPSLESLKLQHNPIGVDGLIALANSIESGHVRGLRELSLGDESFERENSARRGDGTKQLAHVLKSGKLEKLETLDLWRFGEEGVNDVMEAFQSGAVKAKLKSLLLSRNSIGLNGVSQMSRALDCPAFSSLRKLFLSGNESIGDEGILVLAEAFKSKNMDKLEYIFLTSISVGKAGMMKISELLEQGYLPSLLHLDFRHNRVQQDTGIAFLSAYQKNKLLVAEVNLDWPDQSLRDSADWYRRSNSKVAASLRVLRNEQEERAMHGKVFLCGEGGAGKTTLRKSLYRNWVASKVTYETYPAKYEPTRGIEVSHIRDRNVKLALWDLAGQSEYQVLHSAFLPDLAFADGQATLFVIVCRLNFSVKRRKPRRELRAEDASEELLYWLRYIATSSVKRMESLKRHVVLVLNSYKYQADADTDADHWKSLLDEHRKKFGDHLDIHPDPFILDVRLAKEVGELKSHLLARAQNALEGRTVPRICKEIRKTARNLSKDTKHALFPVMKWEDLSNLQFPQSAHVNERKLHAAVEYLHEAGHLIYFRKGSLKESGFLDESFVVLNPEWFCREIVGNLLLTQDMAGHREVPLRKKLQSDGSILVRDLHTHIPKLQCDENVVLALLYRLGIIYKLGPEKVFLPAFFEDDEIRGWEIPVQGQWVMGCSLLLKDNEITILPVSVLRRFQMELAQTDALTDYTAGLSHVTFKMDCMVVLVQFSEDGRNFKPGHASERVGIRVDVLVKPLLGLNDDLQDDEHLTADLRRERQVNLVNVIVEKLEEIRKTCCPGIQFVRKVIKPWRTEQQCEMEDRDVTTCVEEVKDCVRENGLGKVFRNWQVGNRFVRADELLCKKDLADVYVATEQRNELITKVAEALDIQLVVSSKNITENPEQRKPGYWKVEHINDPREYFDRMVHHIDRRFDYVHQHINVTHGQVMTAMQELSGKLQAAFVHQQNLIHQVHSLEMFNIAEKRSSVPRFVYPMQNNPGARNPWKLSQILEGKVHDSFSLHFLCEAYHKDRSLHEVDGQEGIDMKELKAWVRRIAPILVWSLKIAYLATQVAGNAVLPGISVLFPSAMNPQSAVSYSQSALSTSDFLSSLASSVDIRTQNLNGDFVGPKRSGSASREHELRGRAKKHLKDLLDETIHSGVEFDKKVGLHRVALQDSHGNFNDVVWICEPCMKEYQKYGQVEVLDID